MTRRPLLALLATALVAAPAGAESKRTVRRPYVNGGGVDRVAWLYTVVDGVGYGGAVVMPERGERTVEVSVRDDTARPVMFQVEQRYDRRVYTLGRFCGRSDRPMRLVVREEPVMVWVLSGACGPGVSVPTKGLVVATFR